MDQRDFWNERYAGKDFVYGEKPNEYFKGKIDGLATGKILFPAEGEGRNAVYAAQSGWQVSAFDPSEEGKKKAEQLAKKADVQIDYTVTDVENADYSKNSFDALILIYAHFHLEKRRDYHQKLASFLRPGGILILEAFSKKHTQNQQLNPSAGGPRDPEMLYDLEELQKDFKDFDFIEAVEESTILSEGKNHLGKAEVIRIYATKN